MTREDLDALDPDVRPLLPSFAAANRDRLERVRRLLDRLELDAIRIEGHGLAGAGAMYELAGFEAIGRAIEEAARREDADAIGAGLDALAREVDALERAIAGG